MKTIKGITWGHSRGYVPMVATAQRFQEMHPEVKITWEIRTLQQFADMPLETLAKKYDLMVIDHPHAGVAAQEQLLTPLNNVLPEAFLLDQQEQQVGRSYDSYVMDGHLWALPIDAATPVASWRQDAFNAKGLAVPHTWTALLDLARQGLVAMPGIPLDSLMNFYMLCLNKDASLFASEDTLVNQETGIWALETLKELVSLCDPKILDCNPIRICEILASNDEPEIYCPFAYGYSNYSREGYAENTLTYGAIVDGPALKPMQTTLGGAGLAISKFSDAQEICAAYAHYVASESTQKALYFENGGQPGHRKAWTNERVNARSNGFFRNTLADLDKSYLRPRYWGYMHFQDHAGDPVHAYLKGNATAEEALLKMEGFYRASLNQEQ